MLKGHRLLRGGASTAAWAPTLAPSGAREREIVTAPADKVVIAVDACVVGGHAVAHGRVEGGVVGAKEEATAQDVAREMPTEELAGEAVNEKVAGIMRQHQLVDNALHGRQGEEGMVATVPVIFRLFHNELHSVAGAFWQCREDEVEGDAEEHRCRGLEVGPARRRPALVVHQSGGHAGSASGEDAVPSLDPTQLNDDADVAD